jgi:hypothetical protein
LDTKAKTDYSVVATFLFGLAKFYVPKGKTGFVFWLDNAKTHKEKMKTAFNELVEQYAQQNNLNIHVEFVHIPPYSPYLNAAEYFIHLIRHQFLRHLPMDKEIEEVVGELVQKVDKVRLLSVEQLKNIIGYIRRKPKKKDISLMTK